MNTATVSVTFSDNDEGISGELNFGESLTKKFTIENTGTADANVRLSWVDMVNTYTLGSLTYTLSYSESEEGPYTEVISKTNVPQSQNPSKKTLASILIIPVGKTYYYNLVITLNYLEDVNQDSDINATFHSKFNVEDIYKKYQVSFDANGGVVDVISKTITENEVYGALPTATHENTEYEFIGWFTEKSGGTKVTESSIVESNEDHTLYAHWGADSVMMSISSTYNEKIWAHKADIKKIVFEPTMSPKANASYTYDLSRNQNGTIMSYLVPDSEDSTKYVAYIQSEDSITANPNSRYLFYKFTSLESIEGLEYFDTSQVTNMSTMFSNCKSLTTLDLTDFDTHNVTSMEYLFNNCISLTSLNISSFDTSKVTNMLGMFHFCQAIPSLDLSNFDTSKVTNMMDLFSGCYALESLDLSNFDTSQVTNMRDLFAYCYALESLDLSNFDTSNTVTIDAMFYGCKALTSVNLSSFNTSNITSMDNVFGGCTSLTSLDLSNFDTSNVTNMMQMFQNCSSLTSLDLSNFNTGKVTTVHNMFLGCSKLESLNISNFDVSAVSTKTNVFYGIPSSIKITVGNNTLKQWVIDSSNTPKLTSSNIVLS